MSDNYGISISDSWKGKNPPAYFKFVTFNKIEGVVPYLTGDKCITPGIFKGNYRNKNNFEGAVFIGLDMDSPGKNYTIEKITKKIEKMKINCVISPSKSHLKDKEGVTCERYHIFFPLDIVVTEPDDYVRTAKELSKIIFNNKDDSKCHDSSRMFFPSPSDAQIIVIDKYKNFLPIETDSSAIKKLKRTSHPLSLYNISSTEINLYQSLLKIWGHNHRISGYNQSNSSFNLWRNEEDKNPGNFLYIDDNKIYDNIGSKVTSVPFTFNQFTSAIETKKNNIEDLRKKIKSEIIDSIDIKKNYNIIVSSEGLGKSSLVPDFKNKFNAERIVLACKSYEQLKDKLKLFQKYSSHLSIEIITSTEKLLEKYGITERIYIYDRNTQERYLSFEKSVDASLVNDNIKTTAINEKNYMDNICDGIIHKDIVLITEDKLKIEILVKKRFTDEKLIVFDEFNHQLWFSKREPTEAEYKIMPDKYFFKQETWQGHFVTLIETPIKWYEYMKGKSIILTTEEKAVMFFKSFQNTNIIDKRNIFFTDKNITFRSIKSGLLNSKNKNHLNQSFLMNNYITIGNGISSKLNNVSILGQNYHDEFLNQNVAVLITQPCPQELSILMSNLNLTSDEATLLKIIDTTNQIIGRCQGFRNNVKVSSMEVLFPDNLISEILPKMRYIPVSIKKNYTKYSPDSSIVDKIIHTLNNVLLNFKRNDTLFLKQLGSKLNKFKEYILTRGSEIINKLKNMKFFKFSKILSSAKDLIWARHIYSDYSKLEPVDLTIVKEAFCTQVIPLRE